MPRRLCGREAPEQEKESSGGIHEGTRRFLARFFAHTQASVSISAAERSVDNQRGIERHVACTRAFPSICDRPSISFLFEARLSSLIERSNPPVLASVN